MHRPRLRDRIVLPALCALLGWVTGSPAADPRAVAWRAADGLPQTATIGVWLDPRGNVVTTHAEHLPAALLDGFTVHTISNSVGAPTRVYQSASEQLWSVTRSGLLEQTGGGWTTHPIPEISAEYRASPLRAVRPIPLLPLDRNRVLILLPDRLLVYDAGPRTTRVIRTAEELGVGSFNEFSPATTSGAWLSATRGLVHLPAPLRQLGRDTPLEVYPLPTEMALSELQRPFESRHGAVITVAEHAISRVRHVVRFMDGSWEAWPVPDHNLRQAWAGADGELWAHTVGTVFRLEPDGTELRPRAYLQVGRIADLFVEPHGVAWLATSDGLIRIAPLPWRPAAGFQTDAGPVFVVTSDRRGQLVALTAAAVHWQESEGRWRTTALPGEPPEDTASRRHGLFPLPDDRLLIATQDGNILLDRTGVVAPVPDELRDALPLGPLPDARVLLWPGGEAAGEVVVYDGSAARPFASLPPEASRIGAPAFALQKRTGELWIGGEAGLLVRRGDEWFVMEGPDTPGTDGALAACELPDGRVLVGGVDTVREFNGEQWRVLRRGFDRVHTFQLAREGGVWVASGSGLYRLRENAWFNVSEEEGLPAAAVYHVFEDGGGRVRAATGRGLYAFDRRADIDPPRAEISGADVPTEAGDNRALFIVGGQDRWRLTSPGRLMFSFRLDNNPWSTWRPSGSVQYTNLTAGTHRFTVRAMDPSGNVQPSPALMEFNVTLPWFKDPRLVWTSAAVAVLLVALAVQAVLSYLRLRSSYAEVERQVAERSAALERANLELLHSQKMRALGTLAAGVAHDFNNLLSIIKGSAQLIEAHLDDRQRTHQRLQRIRTAVDQGAALVRAMLGYSRGSDAQAREIDAADVALRAIRLLDEPLQARVRFHPPPASLPRVKAPPEMLQQILFNLIQNADDAVSHQGEIHVHISTDPPPEHPILKAAPGPGYVTLSVTDHGVGIPPENLQQIFEPFFTTKGFSSRRGTGLGLSMVYAFAKELGAGIAVSSTVGRGSTFCIILPAALRGAPHGTVPSGEARAPAAARVSGATPDNAAAPPA